MDEVLERKNNSDEGKSTMIKKLAALTIALGVFVLQALPAFACGALVAPNGSVRLSHATTMVAWHDGIERYCHIYERFLPVLLSFF